MKRLLVLIVVLVPLSLFNVGCGGGDDSSGASSGQPTEAQKQEMEAKMQEMMKSGKMGQMPGAPR